MDSATSSTEPDVLQDGQGQAVDGGHTTKVGLVHVSTGWVVNVLVGPHAADSLLKTVAMWDLWATWVSPLLALVGLSQRRPHDLERSLNTNDVSTGVVSVLKILSQLKVDFQCLSYELCVKPTQHVLLWFLLLRTAKATLLVVSSQPEHL